MAAENVARVGTADARRLESLRAALRERAACFVATLTMLRGTAELADPMTAAPRPLEEGVRLAKGTRFTVRTGRALVRFDDGSDLWIEAGATLDLSPWGEARRAFRLVAGRVLALVAKEAARPFVALTDAGEVRVTGTAFEATARTGLLEVGVLHGSVEVHAANGRARAARGQFIAARANAAPGVTPWRPAADRFSWLGDLAPSAANERVRPAFAATVKTFGLSATGLPKENRMAQKSVSGKVLAGVLAAAAIIGAGVYAMGRGNAPAPAPAPGGSVAAPAAAQPALQTEGKRKMVMKINDKEIELSSFDDAELERVIKSHPPEQQAELRAALAQLKTKLESSPMSWAASGDSGGGDAMQAMVGSPQFQGTLERDIKPGVDLLRQLIEQGVPPEEAKKIVEAGLADSLKKQLGEGFGDAKVNVMLDPSAAPGQGRAAIMLTRESEVTPPATEQKKEEGAK